MTDEFGQIAPTTFNIGELPLEIQEMIIIKAAVTRRLSSETFGDVFEALAPVCKLWLDLLKTPVLYGKIKQETFLRDPMCRYLQTAQSIYVTGVGKGIFSIATLGDRLYVVEVVGVVDFSTLASMSRIFVYEIDESAVRHKESQKRVLACTNRQPLAVLGLNLSYSIRQLVPCPRTNTLYVLEQNLHDTYNWAVHKVKPDGTVLLRWDSNLHACPVNSMSLSLSGAYLIMISDRDMFSVIVTVVVYSASTGAFVNRLDTTANPGSYVFANGEFLTSILPDDCLENFAKLSSSKRYDKHSIALDDHMLLLLDPLTLVDTRTDRRRPLPMDRWPRRLIQAPHCWYDKARGLLFFNDTSILRITY